MKDPVTFHLHRDDERGGPADLDEALFGVGGDVKAHRGLFLRLPHPSGWISEADGRAILKALAAHFAELDTADATKAAAAKAKAAARFQVGDRVRYLGGASVAAKPGATATVTALPGEWSAYGKPVQDYHRLEWDETPERNCQVNGGYTLTPETYEVIPPPAPLEPLFPVGSRVVVHEYPVKRLMVGEGTVRSVLRGYTEDHEGYPFTYDVKMDSGGTAYAAREWELGYPETPAPDRFADGDIVTLKPGTKTAFTRTRVTPGDRLRVTDAVGADVKVYGLTGALSTGLGHGVDSREWWLLAKDLEPAPAPEPEPVLPVFAVGDIVRILVDGPTASPGDTLEGGGHRKGDLGRVVSVTGGTTDDALVYALSGPVYDGTATPKGHGTDSREWWIHRSQIEKA